MAKKHSALLALLLALAMILSACSKPEPEESQDLPFTVNAAVSDVQETLDPAFSTARGSETVLDHLYENLMTWTDDGHGHAVLVPGQAESFQLDTDFAGNATYTFTLREGLQWSDGEPVTAQDFVNTWQRLVSTEAVSPHREMLTQVVGFYEAQSSRDPGKLQVSAPDDRTFVVKLKGSCAYFLEEICASPYTAPVRLTRTDTEPPEGAEPGSYPAFVLEPIGDMASGEGVPTNGPYALEAREEGGALSLKKSESYWDSGAVSLEAIRFVPMDADREADQTRFTEGKLDLILDLPKAAVEERLETEPTWLPDPVTAVYAVAMDTEAAPFDNVDVRTAFRLAVSNTALVAALDDPTDRSAFGFVPYGITDYGQRTRVEAPKEEKPAALPPDPSAPVEVEVYEPWDFRAHSLEKVTVPELTGYEEDCAQARELLTKAGYPDGKGFPAVTYIYPESPEARKIAEALRDMWKQQLGVTVELRGMTEEEYQAATAPKAEEEKTSEEGEEAAPAYHMSFHVFKADFCDAGVLLDLWHSGHAHNPANYKSDAYDILMASAEAAVSPEARDAYLHDAEAILLKDSPVIPLYYPGLSFTLDTQLEGLYRGPDGVFFLRNVQPVEE